METVRQLLSPWLVEYVPVEEVDMTVANKTTQESDKVTVLVPSETREFHGFPYATDPGEGYYY